MAAARAAAVVVERAVEARAAAVNTTGAVAAAREREAVAAEVAMVLIPPSPEQAHAQACHVRQAGRHTHNAVGSSYNASGNQGNQGHSRVKGCPSISRSSLLGRRPTSRSTTHSTFYIVGQVNRMACHRTRTAVHRVCCLYCACSTRLLVFWLRG